MELPPPPRATVPPPFAASRARPIAGARQRLDGAPRRPVADVVGPPRVCPLVWATLNGRPVPLARHVGARALVQHGFVLRCRERGGVHLEETYAADFCLGRLHRTHCLFWRDEAMRDTRRAA